MAPESGYRKRASLVDDDYEAVSSILASLYQTKLSLENNKEHLSVG